MTDTFRILCPADDEPRVVLERDHHPRDGVLLKARFDNEASALIALSRMMAEHSGYPIEEETDRVLAGYSGRWRFDPVTMKAEVLSSGWASGGVDEEALVRLRGVLAVAKPHEHVSHLRDGETMKILTTSNGVQVWARKLGNLIFVDGWIAEAPEDGSWKL